MDVRLTTEEAAEYLKVKPSTLRYWRQQNTGPTYRKYGRQIRYAIEDLESYDSDSKVRVN